LKGLQITCSPFFSKFRKEGDIMSSTIDKNDVDISRLFHFAEKFELDVKGKKIPVYMRLVGDAELNRARVFALRMSREMREKLKNPDTDEYMAYIPDLEALTKEQLIESLIALKNTEFVREAYRSTKFNLPIEPDSDASLEEQEAYQLEVDSFDERLAQELQEKVDKLSSEYKNEISSYSKEQLIDEYRNFLINQICEFTMLERFRAMCTYFGAYKDAKYKQRLFNSFEEFDNLPSTIKEKLISFYTKLEIDDNQLKK